MQKTRVAALTAAAVMAARLQLITLHGISLGSYRNSDTLLNEPTYEEILRTDIECEACSGSRATTKDDLALRRGPTATSSPLRRKSLHPECQANPGPRDDAGFLSRVRPCGNLSSICSDIPIIFANRDYPGGGIGNIVPGQDYLVQFDVGLHPEVARHVLRRRFREIDSCVHCPAIDAFGEQCLETVVTGGAMWGDLGKASIGVAPRSYDCMGGCGAGCHSAHSKKEAGAFDCMKHDLCSAWKTVHTGRVTHGFCHDPDCGDEAAMAIFNCWKGHRFFGAIGGAREGPFAEPAVCEAEDSGVKGCWSHSGWFTPGRCKVFQGWDRGQGIPPSVASPLQLL